MTTVSSILFNSKRKRGFGTWKINISIKLFFRCWTLKNSLSEPKEFQWKDQDVHLILNCLVPAVLHIIDNGPFHCRMTNILPAKYHNTIYQLHVDLYWLSCWAVVEGHPIFFFLLHQCLEYNVWNVWTRKCDMYNTELWYIKSAGVTDITRASQRRFLNKSKQGSRLFFGTSKWDSNRECSFTFEQYVNNILHIFCVVYPSLRNAKHTAIFFPLLFDHTMRDEVLQKEWETTGKVSRTWKHGRASVVIRCKRENRRAVIHICRSARIEEEEEHAIHFTERRCRAGMQSHQSGLTFYCEDAGARRGASAVHGLAHIFSLILWEGFWQVEAVRLSSLYILIVLTVLEHLSLKPPGHLRLGLPGDLNGEPHRLRVHHRLIFEGLLKPWSPRPGVILLIFVGCRAINDATLVLHIVLLLLQTDDRKFTTVADRKFSTVARVKSTSIGWCII